MVLEACELGVTPSCRMYTAFGEWKLGHISFKSTIGLCADCINMSSLVQDLWEAAWSLRYALQKGTQLANN